jgi:hypothetical protein
MIETSFGDNVFLTEAEWRTYNKRMPVRYIRKRKHTLVCFVCGNPAQEGDPLEHSHRIGFNFGIKRLGLTPDWLDRHENIVSAHRTECNASAELSVKDAAAYLRSLGFDHPDYLPPVSL